MESVTPSEQIPEQKAAMPEWTVERGHNDFDIVQGNARIAGYIQDERHADMMAASPQLLAAVKGFLSDIEAGLLVRDITRDAEPGWAIRMMPFVQRLQQAQAAVLKAEGR